MIDEFSKDLDRRRTVALAKCIGLLTIMGGEGIEISGAPDTASLYSECLMALGIEDEDFPDHYAAAIALDPEGHLISERDKERPLTEGQAATRAAKVLTMSAAGAMITVQKRHFAEADQIELEQIDGTNTVTYKARWKTQPRDGIILEGEPGDPSQLKHARVLPKPGDPK